VHAIIFGQTLKDMHVGQTLKGMHVGQTLKDMHVGQTLKEMHVGQTLKDMHVGQTLKDIIAELSQLAIQSLLCSLPQRLSSLKSQSQACTDLSSFARASGDAALRIAAWA